MIHANPTVLVQGITGTAGAYWTERMLASGTSIVAGCTPGRGGQQVAGIAVYDTVTEALEVQPIDVSVLYMPARSVKDAATEAIRAGIALVIVVAESVPLHDTMEILSLAQRAEARLIGPRSSGVMFPGGDFVGILPASRTGVFASGRIGVVSRHADLAERCSRALVAAGYGHSAYIDLGSDAIAGTTYLDALEWFENDAGTDAVVMLGSSGGPMEEDAAELIVSMTKPVVAVIADNGVPDARTMGYAATIVSTRTGTAVAQESALAASGALIAATPSDVVGLLRSII